MENSRLLLVEDELIVLDLLEDALTEAGFEVVTASNGTHAMAALNAEAARLRIVITDINLGSGSDGWKVARHARELVPDMPIIYVSGGATHEWPSKGVPSSVLVAKPFVPGQIITAVSALLNEVDARRAALGAGGVAPLKA